MSIVLSTSDVEQLARIVELLASPLDHQHVDDWRRTVNRALSQLVGADSAGFMLPVGDGPFMYSEEHDAAELARYPDLLPPPLADGTPLWQSVLDLKVGRLAEFYRGDARTYYDSAYYRDYAGANAAHDTMCMAAPGRRPDLLDSASIQLWHENPTGRRFDERELALLRIVQPAFAAGVQTQRRFAGQHARLIEMLDTLDQAVRLCDIHGRRLHRSRALSALLAADAEAESIVSAIDAAVRAARLALCPAPSRDNGFVPPRLTFETRTATACYRVVVSLCRNPAGASAPLLLAAVERMTPIPRGEEELRREYGLTKAEARVATLMAGGLPNNEVADRLCISPHTARRHTERVLLKLGVRSRAEVASKVLR